MAHGLQQEALKHAASADGASAVAPVSVEVQLSGASWFQAAAPAPGPAAPRLRVQRVAGSSGIIELSARDLQVGCVHSPASRHSTFCLTRTPSLTRPTLLVGSPGLQLCIQHANAPCAVHDIVKDGEVALWRFGSVKYEECSVALRHILIVSGGKWGWSSVGCMGMADAGSAGG